MANVLIWSDRALVEYAKLQEYLYEEWSEEIAQTVVRIENSPEHFPLFIKRKKIRRCVASPQTSVFFNVNKNVIEIMSIFDNRQNPKKRKL